MAYGFSESCPIGDLVGENQDTYREGYENGLFLQVIQGLSGRMARRVPGTIAGLTPEAIEAIRLQEVKSWGSSEESQYLGDHPELAKAVHDCELRIQLGNCAAHQARPVSVQAVEVRGGLKRNMIYL